MNHESGPVALFVLILIVIASLLFWVKVVKPNDSYLLEKLDFRIQDKKKGQRINFWYVKSKGFKCLVTTRSTKTDMLFSDMKCR